MTIPATGHTYGKTTLKYNAWINHDPDCVATRVCSNCDENTTGHKIEITVKATKKIVEQPTCAEYGSYELIATFTEEQKTQLGLDNAVQVSSGQQWDWRDGGYGAHTYGVATITYPAEYIDGAENTCTATRVCSVCGESTEGHTLTVTTTNVTKNVVETATCTHGLYYTLTAVFTDEQATALGLDNATVTSEKYEENNKISHSYNFNGVCSGCGKNIATAITFDNNYTQNDLIVYGNKAYFDFEYCSADTESNGLRIDVETLQNGVAETADALISKVGVYTSTAGKICDLVRLYDSVGEYFYWILPEGTTLVDNTTYYVAVELNDYSSDTVEVYIEAKSHYIISSNGSCLYENKGRTLTWDDDSAFTVVYNGKPFDMTGKYTISAEKSGKYVTAPETAGTVEITYKMGEDYDTAVAVENAKDVGVYWITVRVTGTVEWQEVSAYRKLTITECTHNYNTTSGVCTKCGTSIAKTITSKSGNVTFAKTQNNKVYFNFVNNSASTTALQVNTQSLQSGVTVKAETLISSVVVYKNGTKVCEMTYSLTLQDKYYVWFLPDGTTLEDNTSYDVVVTMKKSYTSLTLGISVPV